MPTRELAITRTRGWGIAILCDLEALAPDVGTDRPVTVGKGSVVVLVAHAQDVEVGADLATATVHLRVSDAESVPAPRSMVLCDVVLDTPSRLVSIGDADDEAVVTGLGPRTRVVVSADEPSEWGLDEAWIDLVVV